MHSVCRLFVAWTLVISSLSSVCAEKYRICVVDGKGHFKKSAKSCPALDKPSSKVECVVAIDRFDCLRKLQKNKADFSVFTPEDLVAATNAGIEILLTNELRYSADKYDYAVVAVINDNSGIRSRHDLRGKKYCHPGYGYEADWTRILANYFEASVVPPQCNPKLSITENRVKATSDFFDSTCKAGPWVNNPNLDVSLKSKYPNLCEVCDQPDRCTTQDKYWGRQGSLLCLTDGAGDISWARLDDIKQHFGSSGGVSSPEGFSFLCPDDTLMPVNGTREPCTWVVRPWSVIATRRTKAQEIQDLIGTLSFDDRDSWQYSAMQLIDADFGHATLERLESPEPIESYLDRAIGFLSANSFSGCHPPRTVTVCTTSNLENTKCAWLRESAAVYGIEPDLDCIKADNKTHCMMAVSENHADILMVPSDLVALAERKYDLTKLFYETVHDNEKYITVAVTRAGSPIKTFTDLKGKKACFPVYDGVAWNSAIHHLTQKKLIKDCSVDYQMYQFFGPSCVPGMPTNMFTNKMKEVCQDDSFNGEFGALHCLSSGAGDVAFVSKNSIDNFVSDEREDNPGSSEKKQNFSIVCEEDDSPHCHLSWAPVGQAMVRANSSDLWLRDTMNVFQQLDNLFGKYHKSLTTPFTMFGNYDGQPDVLFHDATVRLRDVPTVKNTDAMPRPYDGVPKRYEACVTPSSGDRTVVSGSLLLVVIGRFIFVFLN